MSWQWKRADTAFTRDFDDKSLDVVLLAGKRHHQLCGRQHSTAGVSIRAIGGGEQKHLNCLKTQTLSAALGIRNHDLQLGAVCAQRRDMANQCPHIGNPNAPRSSRIKALTSPAMAAARGAHTRIEARIQHAEHTSALGGQAGSVGQRAVQNDERELCTAAGERREGEQ